MPKQLSREQIEGLERRNFEDANTAMLRAMRRERENNEAAKAQERRSANSSLSSDIGVA